MLTTENRRLLIVDDEPDIRWGYRGYLEPETLEGGGAPFNSYELLEAENGEKALSLLKTELAEGRRFAGAFVDIRLPGRLDGLQFIQEAWKLDPDLLVVIATAYQDRSVDDIDRMFDDRFQDQWDYLSKPFTSGEIIQKSRQIVSSWNRRQRERHYQNALVSQERLSAVGRLAHCVGHEFGNVLQPLLTKLEITQSRLRAGRTGELQALVEEMIEAALLGSTICRDLLTFGRVAPANQELRVVALEKPVRTAVRLLQHELKRKDITLELEFASDALIRCDEPRLVQVFVNLLTNSLHALADGGKIRIDARAVSGKVSLCLSDNGAGVPAALLSRVFQPLFTTKGELGNGLGLPVCKQIVEELGGTIGLESTFGVGTTVRLEFAQGTA